MLLEVIDYKRLMLVFFIELGKQPNNEAQVGI